MNAKISENEANSAWQSLLANVQEDLDSYAERTELHLAALADARSKTNNKPKQSLQASLNMVRALLASADLYRAKWSGLLEKLINRYPAILQDVSYELTRFEVLVKGLASSENSLQKALEEL